MTVIGLAHTLETKCASECTDFLDGVIGFYVDKIKLSCGQNYDNVICITYKGILNKGFTSFILKSLLLSGSRLLYR